MWKCPQVYGNWRRILVIDILKIYCAGSRKSGILCVDGNECGMLRNSFRAEVARL